MFKAKETRDVTNTEFIWKKNYFKIKDGYLKTGGTLNTNRIPLNAIETVVWSLNPLKPTMTPPLRVIGKGVVLAEIPVGIDIIEDIQDWIVNNVIK